MAHSMLHFGVGVAVGTAALLPGFVAKWRRRENMAGFMTRWILAVYGLGILAAFPGMLENIGVPNPIAHGWWMNAFLLHPIIDRLVTGGMLFGEVLVAFCSVLLYIIVLVAIRRRQRWKRTHDTKA